MPHTKALLDKEGTMLFNKRLAEEIGLKEAIVLQQVHYWLLLNKQAERNFEDGKYWTYNTYKDWKENNFPFWSTRTIRRAINSLEDQELLLTGNFNKYGFDKTKWYTINYKKLAEVEAKIYDENVSTSPGQNDQSPCGQNVRIGTGQNDQTNTRDLPKTSTETNNSGSDVDIRSKVNTAMMEKVGGTYSPIQIDKLAAYAEDDGMDDDVVLHAIQLTAQRKKDEGVRNPVMYAEAILKSWRDSGLKTMDDIEEEEISNGESDWSGYTIEK